MDFFLFFFFIDKKEDILKRVVKKAAQGIRKEYTATISLHHKNTKIQKKKYNQPALTNGPTNLESKKELRGISSKYPFASDQR